MKWFSLTMLIAASVCCRAAQGDFRPAATNVWEAPYPRMDEAGRAQLRVNAPNASQVKLNLWGDQQLPMAKQSDGSWMVTTPPLVPGFHYYTLIIDGAEVSDPGTQGFFGGGREASGIEIPEPGSTY